MSLSTVLAEAILSARSDAIIAADKRHHPLLEPGRNPLDFIIPERLRQRHWDGYGRVRQPGQSRYGESGVISVPALRKDGTTSLSSSRLRRCEMKPVA